ncbi:MAG: hypothetical protein AAF747_07555 [Planctomycetota bacterium]
MTTLTLHREEATSADVLPFPRLTSPDGVRRLRLVGETSRSHTDAAAMAEQALERAERRFAQLRSLFDTDDDGPRAA